MGKISLPSVMRTRRRRPAGSQCSGDERSRPVVRALLPARSQEIRAARRCSQVLRQLPCDISRLQLLAITSLSMLMHTAARRLSANHPTSGVIVCSARGARRGSWAGIGAVFPRGLRCSTKCTAVSLRQARCLGRRLRFQLWFVGVGLLAIESESCTLQCGGQSRVTLQVRRHWGIGRGCGLVGLASNIALQAVGGTGSVHHFRIDCRVRAA